jgi:hypothetical protein
VASKATTVEAYLEELPPDRKEALTKLRELILKHLPKGYVEVMNWGMICYEVPLAIEPRTYNGKPLMFAALGSQKNHFALYFNGLYCIKGLEEKFRKAWSGKKLDMGKSCIRAKSIDDLDLKLIGETIASIPLVDFVKASKK